MRVLLVPRNARDTATRKLEFVCRKSPENVFFFHPKSLSKVSRKRLHVFFGPENDEHVILTLIILGCSMRDPENFRETFQPVKLVLVSID